MRPSVCSDCVIVRQAPDSDFNVASSRYVDEREVSQHVDDPSIRGANCQSRYSQTGSLLSTRVESASVPSAHGRRSA